MVYSPIEISGNRGYKRYAKTLYKPTRPKEINEKIRKYTKNKVPHFFIYAKNKNRDQVSKKNKSTVNMLKDIIPNSRIDFRIVGLENFNYKMLLSDIDIEIDIDNDQAKEIIELYEKLDLKKYFVFNRSEDEKDSVKNIIYMYKTIKEKILELNNDKKYVTDVLVEYLYNKKNSRFKATLWSCFGDVIVENIKHNVNIKLSEGYILCSECGKLIKPKEKAHSQKFCSQCFKNHRNKYQKNLMKKYRKNQFVSTAKTPPNPTI